jgi:flagellin
MRINHNIQALNAYRNLSQTMSSTSKSLEKLSSGLRINKAADDAAGLAISEKMRSQIRGLDMAERNTLDAISLIQTGEGALNEVHSILQRMRELSVQAANGTLEDQDREAIQSEIDQLTKEIDRIADTTQFNQKKLFSGAEGGRGFADVNSSQVVYTGLGEWKGVVTADPSEPGEIDLVFSEEVGKLSDTATPSEIEGKVFVINNKKYEVVTSGTPGEVTANGNIAVKVTWKAPADDAAIQDNINELMTKIKEAIEVNDPVFKNNGTAKSSIVNASDATQSGSQMEGVLTLKTVNNMSIKDANEVDIDFSGFNTVKVYEPNTTNIASTLIGKEVSTTSKSIHLQFFELPKASDEIPYKGDSLQVDGLTIQFSNQSQSAYAGGNTAIIDIRDKDLFDIVGEIKDILNQAQTSFPAIGSADAVGTTLTLSTDRTEDDGLFGTANGLEIRLIDNDFEANREKDLELDFQIGANSSESLSISLGVMDAGRLGIGRNSDGSVTNAGVNAYQGIDVMSAESAQAAIDIFDNAVKLVSSERSKLGAIQNRLEHTSNNLQTANENLTSAESRIRDLDMAEEMTNFTRNNILNQAGQAMLAQANQLPQGILQLLK